MKADSFSLKLTLSVFAKDDKASCPSLIKLVKHSYVSILPSLAFTFGFGFLPSLFFCFFLLTHAALSAALFYLECMDL